MTVMMVPIKHKRCGGQVGWYLRNEPRDPDICMSKDYMRIDGTQPEYGALFREKCACCGEWIVCALELERDFSDQRPNAL